MDIFERFIDLQRMYPPSRKGGRHRTGSLAERTLIQYEMFHLAQAIASQYFPDLQSELVSVRRQIMHAINERQDPNPTPVHRAGRVKKTSDYMRPVGATRIRWDDIQITPEVSMDPTITNARVPKQLTKQLNQLHTKQIAQLRDLLLRWDRKG